MNKSMLVKRWLPVIAVLIVSTISLKGISFRDDALDLLPEKAVSGDVRLLQQLGLVNRVILSITLDNPGTPVSPSEQLKLKKFATDLVSILESDGLFTNILYRLPEKSALQAFSALHDRLPLMLDHQDLAVLQQKISASAIDQSLQQDFLQLNSPAGIALKRQIRIDPLRLDALLLSKLQYLRAPFSMEMNDGYFFSKDGKSCLILAESKLDLTKSDSASLVKKALDSAFAQAHIPGVHALVIGSLPHTLANASSIKHDLKILPLAATFLLLLLVLWALKSPRGLVVVAIPFIATPPAIAVTAFFFGKISGIALGFGVVLLGIAVDYGIPLYIALSQDPGNRRKILMSHRKPLFLAYLTTAAVFVILLFSDVPVQRQMAALALAGTSFALVLAWLIVPTIVPTIVPDNIDLPTARRRSQGIPMPPRAIGSAGIIVWLLLLAAGLLSWPRLHYNGDLRSLDVPDRTVIAAENAFQASWGQQGNQAFIVASGKTLDQALLNNTRIFDTLTKNHAVSFQSIAPLLPALTDQQKHLASWKEFWNASRPDFDRRFRQAAMQTGFSEDAFDPFFHWLDTDRTPLAPEEFLTGSFKTLADTMIRHPRGSSGTDEDPYLIMTTAALDSHLLMVLTDLDRQHQGISLLANQKWRAEVESSLREDISVLSLAAALVTILITVVSFPNRKAITAILAPVASALSAMAIFSLLTGGELNIMHLLMGIMVIGISVDYGIFAVCSRQEKVSTISSFAVSICAGSTLCGFGVLAFADHPALHSLGMTVLVGIGAAWPTALLISPVLLGNQPKKSRRK